MRTPATTPADARPAGAARRVRPADDRAAVPARRTALHTPPWPRGCAPRSASTSRSCRSAHALTALDMGACTHRQHQGRSRRRRAGGRAHPRRLSPLVACRCGAAACSRPASAGPPTSRWPRCPASCSRPTSRPATATGGATSPSRSCSTAPPSRCPPGLASASRRPSTRCADLGAVLRAGVESSTMNTVQLVTRSAVRAPRCPSPATSSSTPRSASSRSAASSSFSMRSLATELGVFPATLYWHVGDRSQLLGLVE